MDVPAFRYYPDPVAAGSAAPHADLRTLRGRGLLREQNSNPLNYVDGNLSNGLRRFVRHENKLRKCVEHIPDALDVFGEIHSLAIAVHSQFFDAVQVPAGR